MSVITKLTAAQLAAMPAHVDAWVERALATRPADRARAERGIRDHYRLAGLAPPRVIVWVEQGPLYAMWACGIVERLLRSQLRSQVDSQVDSQVASQVALQVRSQVYSQVDSQIGSQVREQVDSQVASQVALQVSEQVYSQVYSQVDSQVGSQVYSQVASQVDSQVALQVALQVYSQVDSQVDSQLRSQVSSQVYSQVGSQVREHVRSQGREQVGSQVREQVYSQVRSQVGLSWRDYLGGAWWAAWPAAHATYARDVLGCVFDDSLRAAEDVTESGWWFPHRDFVVVTDRPTRLVRDDRGRLHSASGPSIAYGDAWALHHWHGTAVPAAWIERPETLTPALALGQTQVELRTAACEIVGWEKILAQLPHRVIATDPDPEIGTLISVDLPDAPDTRYVRARCGTGRMVHYRASREAKTPLEAAARSYRLKPSQYKPEVRT